MQNYIQYIISGILIIFIFILICIIIRLRKRIKNIIDTEADALSEEIGHLRYEQLSVDATIREHKAQLNLIDKQIVDKIEDQKKIVQANVDKWEAIERNQRLRQIEEDDRIRRETAQQLHDQTIAQYLLQQNDLFEQIKQSEDALYEIKKEVNEYQSKQNAINEEILRRREVQEKEEFYKIQLSEEDLEDVETLQSIRMKLHKIDQLDKLIYDGYISKPVQEMTKRVLKGSAPSGIYKITRLKTGEIYIGKSTDIKSRWQQHAKTSFGVGNIAHSILHTTIEKDGIQNFTFELLEEVPKDKLSEREKFYIDFYQSKQYGLNEKAGG